jgi:hypothetical protein
MKKYIYIIFIAAVSTLAACRKDGLSRLPQTSISPDLFFKTENDLALYTNGLLSVPDRWTYLSDQATDNLSTTGAVEIKNIMLGNASAQNIGSGWDWGRLRDINYFLENYNKANVTTDIKNHYAGLVRYYRAMFYLDKIKRFSDVPWYSHTLTPSDPQLNKPRDPRSLVADSVMADLAFAYKYVRESVPAGTPGKWAVATFYARAALYEGTYRKYHDELNLQNTANTFLQTAANIAGDIMASQKFTIYNTGNPNQDYATLFSSQDLTSNKEVILTNIFDLSKGAGENINGYVFGNYEQSPTKDLLQTYLMTDGSRFTDVANYAKLSFVDEFKKRDPRLMQSIVYPGWIRVPDATPYIQQFSKAFTGYHQLKGYVNSTDNNTLNSVDFPAYRYAEVLLTYAEAQAELGILTQSQLDQSVNLLRKRADMPDLNLAIANGNPDPVLQQQFPNVTGNAGVILEIRRERRIEFAFEGFRFDDLMRWKAGKLFTKTPMGMYFPGLGQYDLTGDGIADVMLIDQSTAIPPDSQKVKNSLGVTLVYFQVGIFGSGATIDLQNGSNGGNIVADNATYNFMEPKYYYRPIPNQQIVLNPNLKQNFGW